MSANVVSVVIVNWNTRELLRGCLESLYARTRTPIEVWVVDNGSHDGSPEMVAQDFPWVRLIANPENRGFAAANNLAFAHATGRYVLLLNSDTVILDHAIDRMVAYMEATPEAGALGCRLLNRDMSLQPSAHRFYSSWGSLIENRLVARFMRRRLATTWFLSYWDHEATREVDWVTGACLMVRSEVIARIGGLDERFFMYGEEVDWQFRMRQAGFRVHFLHTARIVHYGGASAARIPERMRRQELASRKLFIDKHYSWPSRQFYRFKAAVAERLWATLRLRQRPPSA